MTLEVAVPALHFSEAVQNLADLPSRTLQRGLRVVPQERAGVDLSRERLPEVPPSMNIRAIKERDFRSVVTRAMEITRKFKSCHARLTLCNATIGIGPETTEESARADFLKVALRGEVVRMLPGDSIGDIAGRAALAAKLRGSPVHIKDAHTHTDAEITPAMSARKALDKWLVVTNKWVASRA